MRRFKIHALLFGMALLAASALADSDQTAYAVPGTCDVGVNTDFNNDDRSDTVVADPFATVDGQAEAGRVVVLYGDADGLVGEGGRGEVHQGQGTVGGVPEAGDRFGSAIAVADIDCDDYTDLVVGTPYEDLSGNADAGYVQIVWGGPGGLGAGDASRNLSQTAFGVPVAAGDQLGYAVDAINDVDQGGTPAPDSYALVAGAPGYDVGGHNDAGGVGCLCALDGGNVGTWVTQDTAGIPGAAETGDRFGAAVSVGQLVTNPDPDVAGDVVDIVVGVPNEDVGSATDAGSIVLVRDLYDDPEGGFAYDQNSAGVPGGAESGDRFGRSVDTVRVGSTARIAVGVPGEDVGADSNAGSVQLFSTFNTTITPGPSLDQDTAGVGDSTQSGDTFGDRVAWAAPGLGDGATRLAVSAPKENTAAGADAGMVQVFPVDNLGAETTYTQDTAGVPGGAAAADRFGSALSVVEGVSERVLLVGVADDTANTTGMVDVIPFGGGTPRFWKPGTSGVVSAGASRFGDALASVTA